ncbi:MAG: hypothetical protein ABSG43_25630 [Solirubrobacteraceae bacterium]|jgi:hypothetical protein
MPSGQQRQKLLGPAWSGRERPPEGYFTKRTADDWLRDHLDEASVPRRSASPEMASLR